VFVVVAMDGDSVAFYATAGVSSKGGVLTPPFTRLRTTHQLVSPQRIHAEDDTNSHKLIQEKRGLRRYVRPIARSISTVQRKVRVLWELSKARMDVGGETTYFAGLGGCREGEGKWASKIHVSMAFEQPCSHKKMSMGVAK